MGTSLSGLTPATTFDGLLKTSDNDAIGTGLKTISDGSGNDSVLQLSDSQLNVAGQFTVDSDTSVTTMNLRGDSLNINQIYQANETTYNSIGMVNSAGIQFKNFANVVAVIRENKFAVGLSTTPLATTHIKGSGATSATTSLLVQNSAGTELFKMRDDGAGFFSTYLQGTRIYTTAVGEAFPSLSFSGSSGTGIFQPSAGSNVIGFSVSGSEKARIDANGNLGIGETTPTARLHVKGSGNDFTTNSFIVKNSQDTEFFRVRDDGQIFATHLIGQSISASSYALYGADYAPNIRVNIKGSGATSATTALLVQNSDGTDMLRIMDGGADKVLRTSSAQIGSLEFVGANIGRGGGNPITFAGTNQIGMGVSTPTSKLHIQGTGNDATTTALLVQNSDGADMLKVTDDGITNFISKDNSAYYLQAITANTYNGFKFVGGANSREWRTYVGQGTWFSDSLALSTGFQLPTAKLQVKGSGATSATTALLVENSAGTDLLKIEDGGNIILGGAMYASQYIFNKTATSTWLRFVQSTHQIELTANTNKMVVVKSNGVGINTDSADASAVLQADSTTQGFLPPRMTQGERDAITTPAAGLMVYNTDTNTAECWNGSAWMPMF